MVEELLVRIGKNRLKGSKDAYLTPEGFESVGKIVLKRRLMGICGFEVTKPLEDLVGIFHELGAGDSVDKLKEEIPTLYGKELRYPRGMWWVMRFYKAQSSDGKEGCIIGVYNTDPGV